MENSLTGQEVAGYRIGPLLGVGGMGEVYQATPPGSTESVAIKFLRGDYANDPGSQARFIREIRIMEALNHENIMPIFGHGIINGDMLYYTMKLINGMSLSTMMKRQRFTPKDVWEILRQLLKALAYGHSQMVVHRDIKPDNVFIERHQQLHVYLGDFGLGKRSGIDNTLTEADAAIGTPQYMSPEAIMGERPDARSDIYSVCVLSYEMFIGKLPFNEPYAHSTAIAHVTKPVPRLTVLNPKFPLVIEKVLLKGMEKSREVRQQSIDELIEDFEEALDSLSDEQMNSIYRPLEE